MDSLKSDWIWTNPISKSKTFWISKNIFNNRGSLAITNDPAIIPHAPLVSLYFGTKEEKNY